MTDAPPIEPAAPAEAPSPARRIATPRWPALVPRRGLFIALLIVYAIVVGALIAMSVVQHASPH